MLPVNYDISSEKLDKENYLVSLIQVAFEEGLLTEDEKQYIEASIKAFIFLKLEKMLGSEHSIYSKEEIEPCLSVIGDIINIGLLKEKSNLKALEMIKSLKFDLIVQKGIDSLTAAYKHCRLILKKLYADITANNLEEEFNETFTVEIPTILKQINGFWTSDKGLLLIYECDTTCMYSYMINKPLTETNPVLRLNEYVSAVADEFYN